MARSTFKVLFYVNGSKEKNGIVPIMGRVTINGTVAQFSCKQSIPKTLWDVKGNKAKGKSRKVRDINLALDNIKAQIIKHYQHISDREAFVTAEMVRNAYQGIGMEYETLLKAFDKENEVFKKRVGKDRVMATYRSRVVARNYVAAFIKSFYKRNDMSMLELTPDFIKKFAAYLTPERGLRNATIWLYCTWLKGVVMRAHFNGLIPRNPFAQFHISPNVKEREFLAEDELKVLMTHEFEDSKLAYIRDICWEMERKDAEHKKDVSKLTRLAEKLCTWFPLAKEILRMEKLCRLVGFDERQTATLISGKPLEYEGELYSEEHRRKFTTGRADFKVVKDPADKDKLVLSISRKPIGEWFKEQFEKLQQAIRRPMPPLRRNGGMKL